MELELLDLTISCRLCLASCTDKFTQLDSEELIKQLKLVFDSSFEINEWFPKIVCPDCVSFLTQMCNFVQKVIRNQKYLESLELPVCSPKLENNDYSHAVNIEEEVLLVERQETYSESEEEQAEESTEIASKFEVDHEDVSHPVSNSDDPEKDHSTGKRIKKSDCSKKKGKHNVEKQCKEDELIKQYYKLQCDICSFETSNFRTLSTHFRDNHQTSGYVKCCNKKLYRRCRLLEHISTHLNPETFRCEVCNKNYSCKTSLILHNMHQHLAEDSKPFKCTKCPKSFAKDYQLTCHMVRHVAVECPECGKIMSSRLSLKEHVLALHGDSSHHRLVCDTCGKEFRSKNSFQKHVLLHKGVVQDNRLQCHLCKRWLVDKLGLKKHIRTQHLELGESFICVLCGKIAPNSAALRRHMDVHAEEKYECEICGKKFKRPISLKEHRATHTGEPLYSCKFCSMTFISNANMYTHQKRMHPVEWEKSKKS